MSRRAALLIEIGCEEIPARMIPQAAADLAGRLVRILDRANLGHGPARAWGGARRLAVLVEATAERQAERREKILGPPARAAFGEDGEPTRAGLGFARKHGLEPEDLQRIDTDKGSRVGFARTVAGRMLGQLLADELPGAVAGMSFPKTMRWGDGRVRWVRPVHWLLALHGDRVLPLTLFGVHGGDHSRGHRFLGGGPVRVPTAERYAATLLEARVLVDPDERRSRLEQSLRGEAKALGGEIVADPLLLEEVSHLVEWPLVIRGRLDPAYLELPRELLVTTLRHHQKCFCVQDESGGLLPAFLAVANMDEDREGHIRRGNEWVVGGRLDDAAFFWREDRKRSLRDRRTELEGVIFHAKSGSYAQKSERLRSLVARMGEALDLARPVRDAAAEAAVLAKVDLVTALVGEFPELQGIAGGLLLRDGGADPAVAQAVYEHYRPQGAEDSIPASEAGCVVSVADKLDTLTQLLRAGERATGSRDPFGLRRGASGVFRIVTDRKWKLSLADIVDLIEGDDDVLNFLLARFVDFCRESGATAKEINAVLTRQVSRTASLSWPLHDIMARLAVIRNVRDRQDFQHLVDLTKRVDNILTKNETVKQATPAHAAASFSETEKAALDLHEMVHAYTPVLSDKSERREYEDVIEIVAKFVEPVDRFFEEVLVIDESHPEATYHRYDLLTRLRNLLTRYFDIRELAGQAERRT